MTKSSSQRLGSFGPDDPKLDELLDSDDIKEDHVENNGTKNIDDSIHKAPL